jgi:hypothetical protein
LLPQLRNFYLWFKETTEAFSSLLEASAGMIVHQGRDTYFTMEANFKYGQFFGDGHFGTKELGRDRLDRLFARELQEETKGLLVPNLNSDAVLVFDREGDLVDRQIDPKKVDDMILDRTYQKTGSVLLVPLIAGTENEARRAVAYLYSPQVDHFKLPEAGSAAHLLAGAAAPGLQTLFNMEK